MCFIMKQTNCHWLRPSAFVCIIGSHQIITLPNKLKQVEPIPTHTHTQPNVLFMNKIEKPFMRNIKQACLYNSNIEFMYENMFVI